MNLALNAMAVAVMISGCRLLAFAIMSNHFHFVIEGPIEVCVAFFETFKVRLCKMLPRNKAREAVRKSHVSYIRIDDLLQLKNEIAYVIRNPFVARRNVNMFSYQWCSGRLYFNGLSSQIKTGEQASAMSIDRRRAFLHSRIAEIDSRIMLLDGVAMPSCFVDYKRVESFFEDARDYQFSLLKNAEQQSLIAKKLGETITLDDYEMRSVMFSKCKTVYKVPSPQNLSQQDLIELSKTMKYDFGASNAQLARILGKTLSDINQIFPLSANNN